MLTSSAKIRDGLSHNLSLLTFDLNGDTSLWKFPTWEVGNLQGGRRVGAVSRSCAMGGVTCNSGINHFKSPIRFNKLAMEQLCFVLEPSMAAVKMLIKVLQAPNMSLSEAPLFRWNGVLEFISPVT